MAIQYSTTHRSNSMTQLNTDIGANAQIQIYSGSIPANVATAPTGTLLVQFAGNAGGFGTVSNGVLTAAALQALKDASETAPAQEADQPEVMDLPALQAYAELAGRLEDYTAAYNSRHFEQLMALFDQMQQDEEDIEMLLLAV